MILRLSPLCFFFFFNDTATTEIYTLSLHDALPIYYLELLRRAGWIDSLLDEPSITLYASEQNRRSAAEFLRSEEHTSELQSRENLVCRLLLEKKKKKKQNTTNNYHKSRSYLLQSAI